MQDCAISSDRVSLATIKRWCFARHYGRTSGSHVTLVGELQDARAYLTNSQSHVSTTVVDTLDLLQASAIFGGATTRAGVPEVQIGRFSMDLGSGRLVAREAYRDVARTFTGAKARWQHGTDTAVTAFAVLPVLTLPDDRDALLHNDWERDKEHLNQKFWGGLFERRRLWLNTSVDVYLRLGRSDSLLRQVL